MLVCWVIDWLINLQLIRFDLIWFDLRILEFYFNAKQASNPMNPINFTQDTALIDFQEEVWLFIHLFIHPFFHSSMHSSFHSSFQVSFILSFILSCFHPFFNNHWFSKLKTTKKGCELEIIFYADGKSSTFFTLNYIVPQKIIRFPQWGGGARESCPTSVGLESKIFK